MSFIEGSILAFKQVDGTEVLERILWLSPDCSEVVLINITDAKKIDFPHFRGYHDLEREIEEGAVRIILHEPDLKRLAPPEDYLKKHIANRDRKWGVIKDIVVKEPEIYINRFRGKLVAQAGETTKTNLKFVYKYLKQYWFYGKTINGLLNKYHDNGYPKGGVRKGNPGQKSSSGSSVSVKPATPVNTMQV